MDSNEFVSMINKYPHLKFKFRGVFAADFPILKSNCFIIVNASDSSKPGSHWILLYYHDDNMYLADPLGLSVTNYRAIYEGLMKYYQHVQELNANFPLQQRNSEPCGLFGIYIAHVIYTKDFKLHLYMNDNDLLRFATRMLKLNFFPTDFSPSEKKIGKNLIFEFIQKTHFIHISVIMKRSITSDHYIHGFR